MAKKQFKEDVGKQAKFIQDAMGNLNVATDAKTALKDAGKRAFYRVISGTHQTVPFSLFQDLVVEAVVENLGLKQKIFKEYDSVAPEKTIFASNTSSLPISEIAKATNRLDRFGGLHFFNPVPVMKLLEVIRWVYNIGAPVIPIKFATFYYRIPETSDSTFQVSNKGPVLT